MRGCKLVFALCTLLMAVPVLAQVPEPLGQREQPVEPELDRRAVSVPRIDTENFEVSLFAGSLSVDRFGADAVYGLRGVFHASEDFFVEAGYGRSRVSQSHLLRLGLQPLLADGDGDLDYYYGALGYNVLPGEGFLGRSRALTTGLYLLAGAGQTEFADEDNFTWHVGAGLRVLPTDWLLLRLDFRDLIFDSDLLGRSETTHNLEFTLSVGAFF